MDLYKIIPENNNWIISKNIVYIQYLAKVPILVKSGEDVWVYFDVKISKYVIELVKILTEKKINFLFKSSLIFFDHKFTENEFHEINIKQYLNGIINTKFFDGFEKIKFNYVNNVTNYIIKYQCHDIFKKVYQKERKKALTKDYNYYTGVYEYRIEREDIRDYILSLDREIKIGLLF